ncbi:DUF5615 family PIN-like protein [Verrucomicrobium sp. 3C]|uniref:DUF5615 family PIN-like protein n=1 Tax=Verrucomicrobium sp. 3C TaxID=1134055 RepID=UPI000381489C|nr:DUF5615 family PIN-like protein [Verrucomicrobium sp. 3C]
MAESIKFYLDEHVPRAVAEGLRRRGAETLRTQEAGMLGAKDEQHLVFALSEGRVFVTQDADFLRLHAAGQPHAGIVYVPHGTPIGTMIRGPMLIQLVLNAEDMRNRVEFL